MRREAFVETCDGAEVVEAAYAAFGSAVRRTAFARLRDPAAADDVLQDAFLRLHLTVVSGVAPTRVGPWLSRVAANLVTSRARHAQVAVRCQHRLASQDGVASPEDVAIRREDEARIAAALGGLRPIERHALLLAAAGLTAPEIALRVGRSPVAIRALLCRARKRLRDAAGPDGTRSG